MFLCCCRFSVNNDLYLQSSPCILSLTVGWVLCIFSLVLIPYTPDRLWQMKRQDIASDTNPIQGTHVVFLPIYFAAFFSGRHQPRSHYTDSCERCQTSSYTAAWKDTRRTDCRKTKEELVDRQCSGGLCIVRQSGCWNAGTTSERAGRCVKTNYNYNHLTASFPGQPG